MDIIITFSKCAIVLDHGEYDQHNIPNKLNGATVEGLATSFAECIKETSGTGNIICEKFKKFSLK